MQANPSLMLRSISQAGVERLRSKKWATRHFCFAAQSIGAEIPARESKNSGNCGKGFTQHREKVCCTLPYRSRHEGISRHPIFTSNRYYSQGLLTCWDLDKPLVKKKNFVYGWTGDYVTGRCTAKKWNYVPVQSAPGHQSVSTGKSIKVVEDSEESTEAAAEKAAPDSEPMNKNKKINFACTDSEAVLLADSNKYTTRTHNCGQLNEGYINETVQLMGWLIFSRANTFLILGDKYGRTQLYIPETRKDLRNMAEKIKLESVLYAEGKVRARPPGQANPNMSTGGIEVVVTALKVVNPCETLPFTVKEKKVDEYLRLKYRYLDLRQNETAMNNLVTRSNIIYKMRTYLVEHLDFVEVETPTLFKRTPGGAREFVVPTRSEGEYYSLVQSPQQFKQLLMIGAMDRYFQIARCYRDEGFRSDRQPEFTQLDIEMSFCDREGVMGLVEDLLKYIWPKELPPLSTPFPRISYETAMNSYGSDKPDLRFEWKLNDLRGMIVSKFHYGNGRVNMEKYLSQRNFAAHAFVVRKGGAKLTVKKRAEIENDAKMTNPRCSLIVYKVEKGLNKKLDELFNPEVALAMRFSMGCQADDVLFIALGPRSEVLELLGGIRVSYANYMEESGVKVRKTNAFDFVWIVDFPLFETRDGGFVSCHHPFTQPHPDYVEFLDTQPLKVKGLNYDLVVNGSEIGGGSIRVHDHNLQKKILHDILKMEKSALSHMLEALSFGAPIHGGIALGLDRLLAIICGARSLREVIAFPKITNGRDPISGAPCSIPSEEKAFYHLQ